MHHNKRNARIPWTGVVCYEGMNEFRFGTIWTKEYDTKEARRLLEDSMIRVLPAGYTVRHVEKGVTNSA